MEHELILRIEGKEGEIDASTLSEALRLLKKAADAAAGTSVPLPLTRLETGSAVAGVLISPQAEPLASGLAYFAGTDSVPADSPAWDDGVIDAFEELLMLGEEERQGITIEDALYDFVVTLDIETAERARELKRPPVKSLTTLRGKLCGYSNTPNGTRTVTIDPDNGRNAVRCAVDDELLRQAIALAEKKVDATGMATRDRATGEILSMQLRLIGEAPAVASIRPSARTLLGLWSDLDWGGKDSVAIVRELRDAV